MHAVNIHSVTAFHEKGFWVLHKERKGIGMFFFFSPCRFFKHQGRVFQSGFYYVRAHADLRETSHQRGWCLMSRSPGLMLANLNPKPDVIQSVAAAVCQRPPKIIGYIGIILGYIGIIMENKMETVTMGSIGYIGILLDVKMQIEVM